MPGSQGSKKPRRRVATGAHRESHQREWITLASIGVLALVLVVVAVGLVVSWYLPPRAHVLTVGSEDFNARNVADRAEYLIAAGNGNAQLQPADEGIESLIRQQIILQAGGALVGEVTDADVRAAVAKRLGMAEDVSDEDYAEGLANFLRIAPISRSTFEGMIRAEVVEDRLTEQFEADLPEAGDQAHILLVRTNDRAKAQALTDAVRGGADFSQAALDTGAAEAADDVIDLGWYAPETLNERVQPVVSALQAGDVSDPVDDANRIGYEVYFVSERTVDQPYQDEVKTRLGAKAVEDFVADQREGLQVEVDLSSGERTWIAKQMQDVLRDLQAQGG